MEIKLLFRIFIGPNKCKNFHENRTKIASRGDRHVNSSYLKRTHCNGEVVNRTWVLFSPSKNRSSVSCVDCLVKQVELTLIERLNSQIFTTPNDLSMFTKLRNNILRTNVCIYKTRIKNMKSFSIQCSIELQTKKEKEYWRSVSHRIVAVIKYLGSRRLPFRGSNQTCGSVHNGNFLGILDLLAQFDPLISSHIENYGNKGKGMPVRWCKMTNKNVLIKYFIFECTSGRASYLSDTITDELIELFRVKMMRIILSEIENAKYFSISVDSTPDVSHTDQLVFCVRYVKGNKPIERFLEFIPINQHKSEYLTEVIIDFLQEHSIDLANCRGQSYDNTNNMAANYSGLHKRIIELNEKAFFAMCSTLLEFGWNRRRFSEQKS